MLSPFASFSWSASGGKYAQSMVHVLCDWPNAARSAAQQLLVRPKGQRVILFQNVDVLSRIFNHPADKIGNGRGLWFANGVAESASKFGAFVDQIYANKAAIDCAVFDLETGVSCWSLSPTELAAIYADPRYAQLVATGKFPKDCRNMNEAERMLFNYGCGFVFDAAVQKALIAPLYKRYPGTPWSNFADAPCTKADAPFACDLNAHAQYLAPSSAPYYAPSMYGNVGQLATVDPRFRDPWYVLAWTCNIVRAIYRAKAGAKVMPWIAPRVTSNTYDFNHWQENVFHACCLTGMNQLYFNADDPSAISNWRYDNALAQFVGMARGKAWANTLVTALTNYTNDTFVISACRLADKSVLGRVTFKPGVNRAVFTLLGVTYKLTRPAGEVGAWFYH